MILLFLLVHIISLSILGCGNKVDSSPLFPISYNSIDESAFEKDKESRVKKKSSKLKLDEKRNAKN